MSEPAIRPRIDLYFNLPGLDTRAQKVGRADKESWLAGSQVVTLLLPDQVNCYS